MFKNKMFKRILIISVVLCLVVFIALSIASPLMITSNGAVTRIKTDNFDNNYDLSNVKIHVYKENKPIYLINTGFNNKLSVVESGEQESCFKKVFPGLWKCELERSMSTVFEVRSGKQKYYFVYLAP